MASSKKSKKSAMDAKELTQLVVDLRNILQNLSTIATRLERRLSKYDLTADNENYVSREERGSTGTRKNFVVQNSDAHNKKDLLPMHKKKSFSSEEKLPEKRTSIATKSNDETLNNSDTAHRPSIVEDMKKRFEFVSQISLDSSEEDRGKLNEDTSKDRGEITVNVQSLKQKFELERRESTTEAGYSKIKVEDNRRKSEERSKVEDFYAVNGYEDKVKRMLKYFQPKP